MHLMIHWGAVGGTLIVLAPAFLLGIYDSRKGRR